MQGSSTGALWVVGFTFLAGVLAVLFFFAPERHAFYPRCFLYSTTGLQCPGCGGLRAVHQLLHGNVAAAVRLNALLVTALPLLMSFLAAVAYCRATGRRAPNPLRHPAVGFVLLGILLTFGIVRNL